MKRALVIVALLPLAGCAHVIGNTVGDAIPSPPPAKSPFMVNYFCPPLVDYAPDDQRLLAKEMPSDGPISQQQLEDYVKLRQACRAS